MDEDFQPTVGVEIEFLVEYGIQYLHPKMQESILAFKGDRSTVIMSLERVNWGFLMTQRIRDTLRAANLPAELEDDHDPLTQPFNSWLVGFDMSLELRYGDLGSGRDPNTHYMGIEVKSPVLQLTYVDLDQIREVLKAIKYSVVPYVNRSCGLHVHVGNGAGAFTFSTQHKLAALLLGFERQIATLHPPHRQHSFYCRPLSQGHVGRPLTPMKHVERLYDVHSTHDLIVAVNPGSKYFAVNFRYLNPSFQLPFRTVEFRQHEATLDGDEIIDWIYIVTFLVCKAHSIGFVALEQLLRANVDNTDLTIHEVLNKLGASTLSRKVKTVHPYISSFAAYVSREDVPIGRSGYGPGRVVVDVLLDTFLRQRGRGASWPGE